MRGFTRDKILFLSSLMVILTLIGLSMYSTRLGAKAVNGSKTTLVVSAVSCENSKKLVLSVDEKVTKSNLLIDEKYIQLKDSSGTAISLDFENAEVSAEGAVVIYFKNEIDISRLKNGSSLNLKKGFKISKTGKSLSYDVVWKADNSSYDVFYDSLSYKPKVTFRYNGKSKLTMYVGDTRKLSFSCNPDPKCFGGKWYSSTKKVLTIEDGVMTAVSVGTAKISCTFANNGRPFITVEVKKSEYRQSESVESSKESVTSGTGESESGSLPESDSRYSESENISESFSGEQSASESETSESSGKSESISGLEESESESESYSESERLNESESESEFESEFTSESESETVSESDRESESEAETASDRKSEESSDKESENYSDESSDNESSSERESEHDGSGSESGRASESSKTDERGKTDESDETRERGKIDESDKSSGSGEKESSKTGESGDTDESDKSRERGGMSGRTTSNTTSSAAGGSDNSGEIGKDGTEKNGRKIVIPIICIAALLVIGILLISKKGDPHA